MKHHNYYIYILLCADGSYYTGVTNDLERRFEEHQAGNIVNCYTHGRRPLTLLYYEYFRVIDDAIAREKQIKGWSRAKKEALMSGNEAQLFRLSKSYTQRSHNP